MALVGTVSVTHQRQVPAVFAVLVDWSLPKVSSGVGERNFSTIDHLPDIDSTVGKRVRLTKKTRPSISSHVIPDPVPGHSTPRRWKRLLPPSSVGEGGEVGVPRNLFPRLGVG